MTTPLRRAQLIDGHAVTMTDRGLIVDGLEIEYTPTRDEASRKIGAKQRAYMLAGVEAHEALVRVLAEIHPVYAGRTPRARPAQLTLPSPHATVGGPEPRPARGECS